MTILPVLDLRNGVVVRGVAGRRAEYRPVESRLAETPEALSVASGLRDLFGFRQFYVADLDAILDGEVNFEIYRRLAGAGFELLVDAGVRVPRDATRVRDAGASAVVAGLETLPGPDVLPELLDVFGAERVVFSLDMAHGRALGSTGLWASSDPFRIAVQALELRVRRMIVLDLAAVGVGGVTTLDLCRRLKEHDPKARIITGGGVRGVQDLRGIAEAGVEQALVASALHDGRLRPGDVSEFGVPSE